MNRYIPVIILPLLLGACDTLSGFVGGADLSLLEKAANSAGKVEDATLGNAMKALPKYCALPRSARALLRSRANGRAEAEGNKIGVYCVGDPSMTMGP